MDTPTYKKVNKVLEALGGKWNRKAKAHVFDEGVETAEFLGDVVATGEYVDNKKEFQQFFTPDEFATDLVQQADVQPNDECLEPSAGGGAIAKAMLAIGATVDCVEVDPKWATILLELGFRKVITNDFLKVEDTPKYDVIVMNPPFTRSQDIDHVRKAYANLKSGGRLVAVMSSGFTFRSDRKATEFREWFDSLGAAWVENPKGTFKASGTGCDGVTVTIRKP